MGLKGGETGCGKERERKREKGESGGREGMGRSGGVGEGGIQQFPRSRK